MQRVCAHCGETIMDSASNEPSEFDSADSNSLCEICCEQEEARAAAPFLVPWDLDLDCPRGSERKQ